MKNPFLTSSLKALYRYFTRKIDIIANGDELKVYFSGFEGVEAINGEIIEGFIGFTSHVDDIEDVAELININLVRNNARLTSRAKRILSLTLAR